MQNKPNYGNSKMNITLDMTSKYEILSAGSDQKTNPIQTQLKPKQTQFKPISKKVMGILPGVVDFVGDGFFLAGANKDAKLNGLAVGFDKVIGLLKMSQFIQL